MSAIDPILIDNRTAVAELLAVADRTGPAWSTPRAPGHWSPAQVVEHVARAMDEGAAAIEGRPTGFPVFPALLRPVMRMFYNRILKRGAFPKSRTNAAMNPDHGAPTPAEARTRLEAALQRFDQACRNASAPEFNHTVFGWVTVESYARFQALHTRHHRAQLPGDVMA